MVKTIHSYNTESLNNLLFQSCPCASSRLGAEIDLQGWLVSYLLLLHFLISLFFLFDVIISTFSPALLFSPMVKNLCRPIPQYTSMSELDASLSFLFITASCQSVFSFPQFPSACSVILESHPNDNLADYLIKPAVASKLSNVMSML